MKKRSGVTTITILCLCILLVTLLHSTSIGMAPDNLTIATRSSRSQETQPTAPLTYAWISFDVYNADDDYHDIYLFIDTLPEDNPGEEPIEIAYDVPSYSLFMSAYWYGVTPGWHTVWISWYCEEHETWEVNQSSWFYVGDEEEYIAYLEIDFCQSSDFDEYFYSIEYEPFDTDSDGYDDAVEVKMDVDTTGGAMEVCVGGYLFSPSGYEVDFSTTLWSISSTSIEYGYLYLYAPLGEEDGFYDVVVYLEDDGGNPEDSDTTELYLYPPSYMTEWTFMVYLDGDNNLESAGFDDINEMEAIGSSQAVNIIVLFDGYGSGDSKLYHIACDSNGYPDTTIISPTLDDGYFIIPSSGEVNMGDPDTLRNFVIWATDEYPANHYCLVLWDHGDGWVKNDPPDTEKGVCSDWTNGYDSLDMHELKDALNQIKIYLETWATEGGISIDLLAFDACLMSMIEVYYQLQDDFDAPSVNIALGSEETVPFDGFPYNDILGGISSFTTPETLATSMVTDYMSFYGSSGKQTLAAFDLSDIFSQVVPAVDSFAAVLKNNMGNYYQEIDIARSLMQRFNLYGSDSCDGNSDYADLYDFAYQITQQISSSTDWGQEIHNKANDVMASIDYACIMEGHGSQKPNAHGLTIHWEKTESCYTTYEKADYEQLEFAIDTNWNEFLESYYNPQYGAVICGNVNGDDTVNVSDAVYLINYVFGGGPPPIPLCIGDANTDGTINISDVVYIINYVFSGGTSPHDSNPTDGMADSSGDCKCIVP